MLFLFYWICSQVYYYTQEHHFDPFLQNSPPLLKEKVDILMLGGSTTAQHNLEKKDRTSTLIGAFRGIKLLIVQFMNI